MHPDDELKKRLRERFASYEPEPETSWQELEARVVISPNRFRQKGRIAAALLMALLLVVGGGVWLSHQFQPLNVAQTGNATGVVSTSLLAGPDRSLRIGEKELSNSPQGKSGTLPPVMRPLTDPTENKSSKLPLHDRQKRVRSNIAQSKPHSDHQHLGNTELGSDLAANNMINLSFPKPSRTNVTTLSNNDSPSFSTDFTQAYIANRQILKARLIDRLPVGVFPHSLYMQPAHKQSPVNRLYPPPRKWVLKAGPLLSYSVLNSRFRENNNARHLENLRTSLPERLGWHFYIGQQRPLSHGRQVEIGAVFRHFGQSIRYEVPTGEYSVVVPPDQSVIVTQLRDTLSDRSTTLQGGLRLGYRAPISRTAGLHWGIGAEAVYQLNLHRVVMNAEVTLGKTLKGVSAKPVLIELFANTAVRPVYDSHAYVRVLPYHIGLRIGIPLRKMIE